MQNTKMSMRNKVEEIKSYLTNASRTKAVKSDKNLLQRLQYTSKAIKNGEKVTKTDLLDLAGDCFSTIEAYAEEQKKATPKGEASVKKAPPKKKTPTKKEPEKKTPEKKAPTKKTETVKKEDKKQTPKKKDAPKKAPKKKEGFAFPATFEDENYKYTAATDITTIDELREALENEEELTVALHLTPDQIKNHNYGINQLPKNKIPKRFDNDMDLLTVVYVGEQLPTYIVISMYTEVCLFFKNTSLAIKNGKRQSQVFDLEIYRAEEK